MPAEEAVKNAIRHRSDSEDSRRLAALGDAGRNRAGLLLLSRYRQKVKQGPNGEGDAREDDAVSVSEEAAFRIGTSSERKQPFRIRVSGRSTAFGGVNRILNLRGKVKREDPLP